MDFDRFFRETYPRVSAYARTVASAADADDAVAEAYAIAWRRQADIPADAALGWLIGVTRRVLANCRRGERRLGALRTLIAFQRAAPGPDLTASITDLGLRDALGELAPVDREALLLVAWFDLTPAEAARSLDVSPAAFRMRLSRARRRLRTELDQYPNEEPQWQTP